MELVKNGAVVKALTHRFRFTEEVYLTEETLKKLTFSHTFTDNGSVISVSYADNILKVTVVPPPQPASKNVVTTVKNVVSTTAYTPTYGFRFWPQDSLKEYLFREAKSDVVAKSQRRT